MEDPVSFSPGLENHKISPELKNTVCQETENIYFLTKSNNYYIFISKDSESFSPKNQKICNIYWEK